MLAEQIKNYSDLELREQLTGLGMDVGPITGTTRTLYERKLVQLLTGTRSEFSDDSPKSSPPKLFPPKSPPKSSARPSPPVVKQVKHEPAPTYDAADGLHMGEPVTSTVRRPSLDSTINLIRARKPVPRTTIEEPVSRKSAPRQSSPFPAANAQFRKAESDGSAMDHILKFVLFAVVIAVIVYFISNQETGSAIEHRS